eukprot:TRINITY_DN12044_c0_g1_i1.p1 TRINITY_DN12044_c0_g1~~TRINITY_DN12044_c0_g1_i1.p1  ORF type:complete len:240 (-),score=58.71 TRINITY_DN12044_c0_g1_i1:18-710(-)
MASAAELLHHDLVRFEFEIQTEIQKLIDSAETLSLVELTKNNSDLKEDLSLLETEIKKLKSRAEERADEAEKEEILGQVTRHKKEHKVLVEFLRKANLTWKSKMEKKEDRERRELLSPSAGGLTKRKEKNQENMLRMTEQVTESLERGLRLLTQEVDKGSVTLEALVQQSGVLDQVSSEHKSITGAAKLAHSYLLKLKRRGLTDQLLIFFGVLIFILVVLYIVKVRILGK